MAFAEGTYARVKAVSAAMREDGLEEAVVFWEGAGRLEVVEVLHDLVEDGARDVKGCDARDVRGESVGDGRFSLGAEIDKSLLNGR